MLGILFGWPGQLCCPGRAATRGAQVVPDRPLAAAPPGQLVVRATQDQSDPMSQLRDSYGSGTLVSGAVREAPPPNGACPRSVHSLPRSSRLGEKVPGELSLYS